jgi:hypothetical protein
VVIVVAAKTAVIRSKTEILFLAAGYISSGINGSQGPKTKMRKRTQGVMLISPVCP